MYCRNYTGTISHVLCREVCHTACVHIWESPLSEVSLYSYNIAANVNDIIDIVSMMICASSPHLHTILMNGLRYRGHAWGDRPTVSPQ